MTFEEKYNDIRLADAGSTVSPEYRKFQNSLVKEIGKAMASLDIEVVSTIKGHYFESFFFKRNGNYVYVSRESLNRAHVELNSPTAFMVRTAKDDKDFCGGTNRYCSWQKLPTMISRLLNKEA